MTPEQEERLARSRRNGGKREFFIVDVETLPCPETMNQFPHQLTNTRGQTRCVTCGFTWAELDEEMRRGRSRTGTG